jgi:hypothetical protein
VIDTSLLVDPELPVDHQLQVSCGLVSLGVDNDKHIVVRPAYNEHLNVVIAVLCAGLVIDIRGIIAVYHIW